MGHYIAYVIGHSTDNIMARFSCYNAEQRIENDFTDELINAYRLRDSQHADYTLAQFASRVHGLKLITHADLVSEMLADYAFFDDKGELLFATIFHTANSKHDGWQVTKAVANRFKLKEELKYPMFVRMASDTKPGYAYAACRGDIDFEGMIEEAAEQSPSSDTDSREHYNYILDRMGCSTLVRGVEWEQENTNMHPEQWFRNMMFTLNYVRDHQFITAVDYHS